MNKIRFAYNNLINSFSVKNWFVVIVFTCVLFLFFSLLTNISLLYDSFIEGYFLSVLFPLIKGIFVASEPYVILLLFIICFLTMINLVLVSNRALRLRRSGVTAFSAFLGILVTGCPSCATGILPVFGIVSSSFFVYFQGVYFMLVSVVLLLFTLYWNAKSEVCSV